MLSMEQYITPIERKQKEETLDNSAARQPSSSR
jgi:hypothetical protein